MKEKETFIFTARENGGFDAEVESNTQKPLVFGRELLRGWLSRALDNDASFVDSRGVAITAKTVRIVVTMEEADVAEG